MPESSVAVKVTVTAPVGPHKSLNVTSPSSVPKLLVQSSTLSHASVATAPPLLANHVLNAVVLLATHSTSSEAAGVAIAGAVTSAMVTFSVVSA